MDLPQMTRILSFPALEDVKQVLVKAHDRRDPKTGKVEHVNQYVRVLHGTAESHLDSILAKGIITGQSKNWAHYAKHGEFEEKVFVSTNKQLAIQFGRHAAHGGWNGFVVVEAEIPASVKMQVDERVEHTEKPMAYTLDTVKPEWIKKVHYYQIGKSVQYRPDGNYSRVDKKLEGQILHKRTTIVREAKEKTIRVYIPLLPNHPIAKKYDLKEATATVRAHPSHSKKGKVFNVRQYARHIENPEVDPTTVPETGKVNLTDEELKTRQKHIDALSSAASDWLAKNTDGTPDMKELAKLSRYLGEKHKDDVDAIVNVFEDRKKYINRPSVHVKVKDGPDIYLLGWRDTKSDIEGTEIHDHGPTQAGVYVHKGTVVERIFGVRKADWKNENAIPFKAVDRDLKQGGAISVTAPYIHEVYDKSDDQLGVTIHSYYPPLKHMNFYKVKGNNLIKSGTWKEAIALRIYGLSRLMERKVTEARIRVKAYHRVRGGKVQQVKSYDREVTSNPNVWKSKLTKDERYDLESYIDTHVETNDSLRSGRKTPIVRNVDNAINKFVLPRDTTFYRGVAYEERDKKLIGQIKIGNVITDKAFLSTSLSPKIGKRFTKPFEGQGGEDDGFPSWDDPGYKQYEIARNKIVRMEMDSWDSKGQVPKRMQAKLAAAWKELAAKYQGKPKAQYGYLFRIKAPSGMHVAPMTAIDKSHRSEQEYLFPRNTKLRIDSVTRKGNSFNVDATILKEHIIEARILSHEILERKVKVRAYTKHSETGKVFSVRQSERTLTRAAAKMRIIGATPNEEKHIREILSRHDPMVVDSVPFVAVLDRKNFVKAISKGGYRPDGQEIAWYDEGRSHITINRSFMTASDWKPTLDHELGHAAQFHSKNFVRWNIAYSKDKKFDRFTWYSKTNELEGFAESYMAFMATRGRAKNARYKKVFDMVRTVLKGVDPKVDYTKGPTGPGKRPTK